MVSEIGLIATICIGLTLIGIILGFLLLQIQTKF
jgi:hypothetical protein